MFLCSSETSVSNKKRALILFGLVLCIFFLVKLFLHLSSKRSSKAIEEAAEEFDF